MHSKFSKLSLLLFTLFLVQCRGGYQPELTGFSDDSKSSQIDLERKLLQMNSPDTYRTHLFNLTQEPTVAGTPGAWRAIEYITEVMNAAGLYTEHYEYDVLLPQPGKKEIRVTSPVEILLNNQEFEYDEDPFSSHPDLVHGYTAYSGSGEVEAAIVYANYGTREDFIKLQEMGVNIEGKIVISRYGGNFRGYKAKYAEEAGAAGLIIYTDPGDSGFVRGDVYPNGIWADESSIQRGSLLTLDYFGDPLTPFEPALPLDHPETPERLDHSEVDFHTIPVVPIGYGAADEILRRMTGETAPDEWQGGFDYEYRLTGGEELRVSLKVDQPYEIKRIANVIGTIERSEYPDEWIILGSHFDAWGFGATDPNSGTAMLLTLAESLGELAGNGYQPKRSIMIGHWDAEEFMLIGSSEWVMHLEEQLNASAVLYLNADMSVTGPNFRASSSPSLKEPIMNAAKSVRHPDTGQSLYGYWLDRSEGNEPEIGNLGGGSDHVGFYMYSAIPSAGISMSGAVPIYHTNFDTFWFYENHLDGTFTYGPALADVYGLIALRFANADILPYDIPRYAYDLSLHMQSINEAAGDDLFSGTMLPVQAQQLEELTAQYNDLMYNALQNQNPDAALLMEVNRLLIQAERSFLNEDGLPFSAWLRSLYAASDPFSGYASWMLPAYRYAIDQGRTGDTDFMGSLHTAHEEALGRLISTIEEVNALLSSSE
jgi:N-acetylated-alpha-linked acidic dipeptidase